MNEKDISTRLAAGRAFTRCDFGSPRAEGFVSDQDQKKPQPPLVKAPMRDSAIRLPYDFDTFAVNVNYAKLVASRRTRRVYSGEGMTLDELAFILWACQGVGSVRGKSYATLRTVPSAGARHAFETYVMVNNIAGLERGMYHYLPMTHSLELLYRVEDFASEINSMTDGQRFAGKADAVFFFSMVAYRAEWRYGIHAHRLAMMDIGYVGQAIYMACEALDIGSCAIGAYSQQACDDKLGLDGNDEYTVYIQSVGRYKHADAARELEFYAFLDEE